jgi:hypothetical protein
MFGKLSTKNRNRYGKQTHTVIYGPNRKEYHIYDKDVDFITKPFDDRYHEDWQDDNVSFANRNGNVAVESKLKIYILTHILDDKENWCFDLNKIPVNGKLKVIYKNGTVKNIDFKNNFHRAELKSKRYTWKRGQRSYWPMLRDFEHSSLEFIEPFAYRKVTKHGDINLQNIKGLDINQINKNLCINYVNLNSGCITDKDYLNI